MNYITVGVVARPQGIKGEVKISPLTDDNARFHSLRRVHIDGKDYDVVGCKVNPAGVFLSLSGIADRNSAELLRGKRVLIDRLDAVPLDNDRYFIVDIIGCELKDGDKVFGHVVDVLQYGAADIYVASTADGRRLMFPALKDVILSVDIDSKVIAICLSRLNEVAVYED
ncbi:MAG: ribosome maturation factor RimM [Clostridia bacterium]|nr:ribosome maturation factor RimM [Clostridia bacterium]